MASNIQQRHFLQGENQATDNCRRHEFVRSTHYNRVMEADGIFQDVVNVEL